MRISKRYTLSRLADLIDGARPASPAAFGDVGPAARRTLVGTACRLLVVTVAVATASLVPASTPAQESPLTPVATAVPAPPLGAPILPPGPVGTSHLDPYDNGYDYAINNCHTYANNGVINGGGDVGIIRCWGTPGVNVGGHTVNYTLEYADAGVMVTMYNYGATCSFLIDEANVVEGTPVIDPTDPGAAQCLNRFCPGDLANFTVLPPGQLDDVPGYAACVRMGIYGVTSNLNANVDFTDPTVNQQRRTACLACCTTRVGQLTGWGYPAAQVTQYSQLCTSNCNGFFQVPPGGSTTPSFWSGFWSGLTGGLLGW
ncbi:MAG: hypothetical protein L0027_17425 [Candidatus Rokubacteria bacterium]|nr:hypothetical protein [Candidatus Rokubacteria bacterium]